MGSSEINKDNIITASMEELTEEERKAYLLIEEHVKAQFFVVASSRGLRSSYYRLSSLTMIRLKRSPM